MSIATGKLIACPFYSAWTSMLHRCYDDSFKKRSQAYIGCTVCEDWLTFSNFKAWMEQQDWQGNELDKDLLVDGNKVYSPEACIFVSQLVNSFMASLLAKGQKGRGKFPVGVRQQTPTSRYIATCYSVLTGTREYLGTHDTPEEASAAYLAYKNELLIKLAMVQTDERIRDALLKRAW